jgi:hypothetical protein
MTFTIVGLKFYIKEWGNLAINSVVVLVPEPDNKYDKNAIACYFEDKKVGYVSKNQNVECKKYMRTNKKTRYSVCMIQGFTQPVLFEVSKK